MALIKCSECGKEISDKAATCPNCGSPTEKAEEDTKVIAFILGMVVLIALVGSYAISCRRNNPSGWSTYKFLGRIECPQGKW